MFSWMDLGKGLDFWNTMPTRLRSSITSTSRLWMACPPMRTAPSMRTWSMRSFIRLKQRSRVDLPQPLGPMNAVTIRSRMLIEMLLSALASP